MSEKDRDKPRRVTLLDRFIDATFQGTPLPKITIPGAMKGAEPAGDEVAPKGPSAAAPRPAPSGDSLPASEGGDHRGQPPEAPHLNPQTQAMMGRVSAEPSPEPALPVIPRQISPDEFFLCRGCGDESTMKWKDPDLQGYCLKCVREGIMGQRQLRRAGVT